MEDNYEENMIAKYGEKIWNRAVALFEALVGDYPDFSQVAECDDVRKIAEGLLETEEKPQINVAAQQPELPKHRYEITFFGLQEPDGFLAHHVEIKDGCVIAYLDGHISIAYAEGEWARVYSLESDAVSI
jgi:hypothetical protein